MCHLIPVHSRILLAHRIHTTARELPMKRVAIQLTIASNLPWPVTLTALTLEPQHGFRLDPAMGLAKPLCPLTLSPSSTASAVLFVSKSGGRSASRANMLRGGAGQGKGPQCCHAFIPSPTPPLTKVYAMNLQVCRIADAASAAAPTHHHPTCGMSCILHIYKSDERCLTWALGRVCVVPCG